MSKNKAPENLDAISDLIDETRKMLESIATKDKILIDAKENLLREINCLVEVTAPRGRLKISKVASVHLIPLVVLEGNQRLYPNKFLTNFNATQIKRLENFQEQIEEKNQKRVGNIVTVLQAGLRASRFIHARRSIINDSNVSNGAFAAGGFSLIAKPRKRWQVVGDKMLVRGRPLIVFAPDHKVPPDLLPWHLAFQLARTSHISASPVVLLCDHEISEILLNEYNYSFAVVAALQSAQIKAAPNSSTTSTESPFITMNALLQQIEYDDKLTDSEKSQKMHDALVKSGVTPPLKY